MEVFALHGFLGSPKDFSFLQIPLLKTPNIFNSTIFSMEHWCDDFCLNYLNKNKKNFLIGYSMGARLALMCITKYPKKFFGAVIICGNPGLKNEQEKQLRRNLDYERSLIFKDLSFSEALDKWNSLGVFANDEKKIRTSADYSKENLVLALRRFSLGRQQDLSLKINTLELPVWWYYPKQESAAIKNIKLAHKQSKMLEVDNAGHRLIFSHQDLLNQGIIDFIDTLKQQKENNTCRQIK